MYWIARGYVKENCDKMDLNNYFTIILMVKWQAVDGSVFNEPSRVFVTMSANLLSILILCKFTS